MIESSVFQNVAPPPQDDADFGWVTTILSSATMGNVDLVTNLTDSNTGASVPPSPPNASIPIPYPYKADPADAVEKLVRNCAGTGVVPSLPPAKN